MKLFELTGVKHLSNLTIDELGSYFIQQCGYEWIGSGAQGSAFKHPSKDEIIKFWVADTAYDDFMAIAKQLQNSPYLVKIIQGPKHLTMFHNHPLEVTTPEHKKIKFPDKINYVRLEHLTPMTSNTKCFGLYFEKAMNYIGDQFVDGYIDGESIMSMSSKDIVNKLIEKMIQEDKGIIVRGRYVDKDSLAVFMGVLFDIFKKLNGKHNVDLHAGNVMMRGDVPVIIDPFNDLTSSYVTSDFMFYSNPENQKGVVMASGPVKGIKKR
jgi:hypothetical protein